MQRLKIVDEGKRYYSSDFADRTTRDILHLILHTKH